MKHPIDDIVAFFSGVTGAWVYSAILGIHWSDILTSAGQLLWMIVVAMITGGAGVLGKHWMTKLLKRKK